MSNESEPSRLGAEFIFPRTVTLRDARAVTIRRLTEEDAEAACRIFPQTHTESDFLMYLPGEFDFTVEQEREWIRERSANEGALLLTAECDGRLVAFAGAEPSRFKRQRHHAELGITVVREFWGLGLGRRLTECIIEWAMDRGLRKLYLRVYDDNERAIALYRSLGFVEEGRLRGDILRADGRFCDVIVMARHLALW